MATERVARVQVGTAATTSRASDSYRSIETVETFKRTPLQLFNLPQYFVIPRICLSSHSRVNRRPTIGVLIMAANRRDCSVVHQVHDFVPLALAPNGVATRSKSDRGMLGMNQVCHGFRRNSENADTHDVGVVENQ